MSTMLKSSVSAKSSVARPARGTLVIVAGASGGVQAKGKIDVTKIGVNSVASDTVRNNLMGRSRYMKSKDWRDSQGRKGKGLGVYRFEDKYGANVDGQSPIYTPDTWSKTGDTYQLGTKGLIAWAGLLTVLLGVGVNLIVSTSQIA